MKDNTLKLIGQIVVQFGLMESKLDHVVQTLVGKADQWGMAMCLLPSTAATSQKLDSIERLINLKCAEKHRIEWKIFIRDLRELFSMRNKLYHGSIHKENNVYTVFHDKKTPDINKSLCDFELNDLWLEDLLNRVHLRMRQMWDFTHDYSSIDKGEKPILPLTQNTHSRLQIW